MRLSQVIMCCCLLAPTSPAGAQATIQASDTTHLLPAVYQNWRDQEVHWIITPQELAQFNNLSTNNDRDQFIVQFWLLRDPTPDTEENEYKEEIYRRVAFSNAHFAAGTLGSLTDRGRIYIRYGPPDEITVVHVGRVGEAPTQTWHYEAFPKPGEMAASWEGKQQRPKGRRVDLTFVDNCKCGNYELRTPEPRLP